MTLSQTIKQCNFDYVNENITAKNFPDFKDLPDEPTELIGFEENLTSEQILDRCKEQNMRPANAKELLAYALKNPEEQRKYPIVALGSSCVVSGDRHVLVLCSTSMVRGLGLDWFDDRWHSRCRFLVVRKSDPLATQSPDISLEDRVKVLEDYVEKIKKFIRL